jgi:hypothetical protein
LIFRLIVATAKSAPKAAKQPKVKVTKAPIAKAVKSPNAKKGEEKKKEEIK